MQNTLKFLSDQATALKKISWLKWLDENILAIWSGFLLVFIPLYPKIPLYSPIEAYIVRVRLEDLMILIGLIIWLYFFIKGRVKWRQPLTYAISTYLLFGFLSMLSAVFLIKTVPLEPLHIAKTLLHYLRYIEYFSLFFIVFSAIRTRNHVKIMLGAIIFAIIAIAIYGYGQRHFYWPVYSTMNREFSKGIRLYLTENARVQSTFAGHYDLGAYLVIVLPILLGIGFTVKKWWQKLSIHAVHWLGLWLLVISAARTSFLGYLIGLLLVTILFASRQPTLIQKIKWASSRYLVITLVVAYSLLNFGDDIYERFLQVLKSYPEAHQTYHELNRQRIEIVDNYFLIPLGLKDISLPKAQKPDGAISTDEAQKIVLKSDTTPSTTRPRDVYDDIPDKVEVSSQDEDGNWITTIEERDRVFSENAMKYGLSLAIRLDALWPQAIAGFWRQPLLGSGYATLNKMHPHHFTEADGTDNNYLRILGETGLLGFISFFGIIAVACFYALRAFKYSDDSLLQALSAGYLGASLGLLINAVYIDVYAASKVAQVYWAITGVLFGFYLISQPKVSAKKKRS